MSKEVRALAQQHSAEAIEVLVKLMRNEKASPAARTAAASQILDRAIGRPESSVDVNARIRTETMRLDYSVLTQVEIELLNQIGPILSRPGFMIEDGGNSAPVA